MPWRPMTAANCAAGSIMKCTGASWRDSSPGTSRKPAPGMWPASYSARPASGWYGTRLARRGGPQPGGALEDPQIRIAKVRREPVGLDQRIGVVVACHALPLLSQKVASG